MTNQGFLGGSSGKEYLPIQETQVRSLGEEDPLEEKIGNPLQYSCPENPMDRGAQGLQSMRLQSEVTDTLQLSTCSGIN